MITYQILDEQIVVFYNNSIFLIKKDDFRYDNILKNINDLKPSHFLPESNLPNGFRYQDGSLYFHKFKIPAKLEEKITMSENKESFLNFWANLLNRYSFDEISQVWDLIIDEKLYPITNDGLVLYSKDNKVEDLIKSPFIITKYDNIYSLEKELFFPIEFWKKTEFVNSIKKLLSQGVRYSYLKAISHLIKNQSLDDIVFFLKNPPLIEHQEVVGPSFSKLVNLFLKNKENKFDKQRFSTLINYPYFFDLKSKFSFISKEKLKLKLNKISVETAHSIINREFERIKEKGRTFFILEKFPNVKDIESKTFERFEIVVPKTSKDLVLWGAELHNCVGNGSYSSQILKGQIYILGLMSQNEIVASIEVNKDHKIVQFEWKKQSNFGSTMKPITKVQEIIDNSLKKD